MCLDVLAGRIVRVVRGCGFHQGPGEILCVQIAWCAQAQDQGGRLSAHLQDIGTHEGDSQCRLPHPPIPAHRQYHHHPRGNNHSQLVLAHAFGEGVETEQEV